ncbi:MAG: AraC family transcriptional regulator [Candidatus Eremiobacteraeota bacterium]|nr:AraC family transcriptional regulator [Candidatus Eremiobacteraeota bacterium]
MKECQSCGAPMHKPQHHAGGDLQSKFCKHCAKEDGSLQEFETRFAHLVDWSMRHGAHDRAAAEERARLHMRRMPLWKNHPSLKA